MNMTQLFGPRAEKRDNVALRRLQRMLEADQRKALGRHAITGEQPSVSGRSIDERTEQPVGELESVVS